MKAIMLGLMLMVAGVMCAGAWGAEYAQSTAYHRVRAGETFWGIAGQYYAEQDRYHYFGEWVHTVRCANPSVDAGNLQVGEVIVIPLDKKIARK